MNHTNVVDVKAWIDTRPVSRFQWNVLLLCFIIIMLDKNNRFFSLSISNNSLINLLN